jgi:hypothetical protein
LELFPGTVTPVGEPPLFFVVPGLGAGLAGIAYDSATSTAKMSQVNESFMAELVVADLN